MTLRDINQYGPGFQIKVLSSLPYTHSKNFFSKYLRYSK